MEEKSAGLRRARDLCLRTSAFLASNERIALTACLVVFRPRARARELRLQLGNCIFLGAM